MIVNNYSLIKFTPTKRYASIVDPQGIPRFVCFPNESVARKCVKDMCEHRCEYGSWPSVDFTHKIATLKKKNPQGRKRKLEELERWFIIETMDDEQFTTFAQGSGAQFFYCHEFSLVPSPHNTLDVRLKGQEIIVHENIDLYRQKLEAASMFNDEENIKEE